MHKKLSGTTHQPGKLTSGHIRTLSLSALGGMLEFYDFVIFIFFSEIISKLFFPPDTPDWLRLIQVFGIFASGYLARPLGGIVMAHFGDLLGRKRMFMFSIVLMAIPTLFIGLLPTYATIGAIAPTILLLLRITQGVALGGEAPGAWVFVTEHVSPQHRTVACGSLTAGLLGGILLGSLVAIGLEVVLTSEQMIGWGWRLPFLIGGAFGLISMHLRRKLHETPVFITLKENNALASEMPIKTVLQRHWRAVVLSIFLTWTLTAAVVVPLLMMPTLLENLGLDRQQVLIAHSVAVVLAILGNVLIGMFADRYGPARALIIFSTMLGVNFWIFHTNVLIHPDWMLALYALVGFSIGVTAVVPAIIVSQFPPHVRFTGLSLSYNLAYAIFGGITPIFLVLTLNKFFLAPAYYMLFISVISCIVGWYIHKNSLDDFVEIDRRHAQK